MPERATALTAAAGEHFVAYKLSALGYPVAMTRGGSPTIDLMVGDLRGQSTVSIQVKTSNWARRDYKRKTENNHWEWDVGEKALTLRGDSIFYAFVDLKWDGKEQSHPDVYVVPSKVVADSFKEKRTRYMFWIWDADKDTYLEGWEKVLKSLRG